MCGYRRARDAHVGRTKTGRPAECVLHSGRADVRVPQMGRPPRGDPRGEEGRCRGPSFTNRQIRRPKRRCVLLPKQESHGSRSRVTAQSQSGGCLTLPIPSTQTPHESWRRVRLDSRVANGIECAVCGMNDRGGVVPDRLSGRQNAKRAETWPRLRRMGLCKQALEVVVS
jgi:hypothetical protein